MVKHIALIPSLEVYFTFLPFKIKKSTYDIYSKNGASYGMYTEIERNKKLKDAQNPGWE